MQRVGLRIDVDTLRGTREGVPRLLDALAVSDVHASFFFSVGPDNMGRHAWRLLNPRFAWKMLRSNAPALYGWDILLAGVCWPGRSIARNCRPQIRATAAAGHEVGLHAWDHHRWQINADRMSVQDLQREIALGVDALGEILGHPPTCSAAPAWKCNDCVLEAKEAFAFTFNSDCRGRSIFVPVLGEREATMQIPTTLPTYDESIGRDGVTPQSYNDWLLNLIEQADFNVLTIHAEVEGIACAEQFDAFLASASERNIEFVPLGQLLATAEHCERAQIVHGRIAGRSGTLARQAGSRA